MERNFLKSYVFGKSTVEAVKIISERVSKIIKDERIKKTEVIRDGGFVHGRIYPVLKK